MSLLGKEYHTTIEHESRMDVFFMLAHVCHDRVRVRVRVRARLLPTINRQESLLVNTRNISIESIVILEC